MEREAEIVGEKEELEEVEARGIDQRSKRIGSLRRVLVYSRS